MFKQQEHRSLVTRPVFVLAFCLLVFLFPACRFATKDLTPAFPVQEPRNTEYEYPVQVDNLLAPAAMSRLASVGERSEGVANTRLSIENAPDEVIRFVNRIDFDFDEDFRPFFEWQPLSYNKRLDESYKSSTTGDIMLGFNYKLGDVRIGLGGQGYLDARTGIEVFAVFPHGNTELARWSGIIEGEEGFYARGIAEFGNEIRSLVLNFGVGAGGRPKRGGKTGRIMGGVAWSEALPILGAVGEERTRFGLETFWVEDQVGRRSFGEISISISTWFGATELSLGFRKGILKDNEDNTLFLSFATRLLDTLN